jgi:RHS repeat-associated protein
MRTGMSDGSGQTAWSFDSMGRALTVRQTIGTVTKSVSYSYNYDGSTASVTYPSGRIVSYDVTGAGLPTYAKDIANSINYALNTAYAPHGALGSIVNGQATGFSGITETVGYNSRLVPTSMVASSSNGTALSLAYSYFANNNVNVITNNRDTGRTQTFGYDALNRITSAYSQANSGNDCWGQSIPTDGTGYDRYGNLLKINVSKCSAPSLNLGVNAYNRVSAFSYDAPGDVTNDGFYNYSWDAEGHMTAVGSTTYTFDGDGRRAKKTSGTLYWYGGGMTVLAETDTSGNTTNEYVLLGGRRIARRDGSGNVYYYFKNHLGSTATITNATGTICYDADFYPLGGELSFVSTCSQNYKFAGMERDPEDGLDHTLFRQYASNLGRWLSPDPLGGDVSNSQSLNRYAYVGNNPTNFIDPLGLDNVHIYEPPGGNICDLSLDPGCEGGAGPGAPGDYTGLEDPGADLGDWTGVNVPWGASGPLSGDYGANLPIPPPGVGLPCDFGTCGPTFSPGNGFAATAVLAGVGEGLGDIVCPWCAVGLLAAPLVAQGIVGGYQIYLSARNERQTIRDAARIVGVDARELGDAIEEYKREHGIPGDNNLDWATIIEIAKQVKQGLYKGKKG